MSKMELTKAYRESISRILTDDSPESISKAALSLALSWGVMDEVEPTDLTEDGADGLVEAQRFVSELEEAVIQGVKDGSIVPRQKSPSAKVTKKDRAALSDELKVALEFA